MAQVVDGPAGHGSGAGPFTLHVACTLRGNTVWDGDVVLGGDDPLTATIRNIAADATCTVTETDAAGANSTVIDPETVVIAADATVSVTTTNTFLAGSITVTKTIDGAGADRWGAGPFEVTLDCVRSDGVTVDIPGGAARTLSADNGYSTTYEPLLVGLACTLTETKAGGATSTTITDANGNPLTVIPVDESDTPVSVTNTFDVGSLVIAKTLSGGGSSSHAGDSFGVTARCRWNGSPIDIPDGATRTLTTAQPVTYGELPVGAECEIAETDAGGADGVTFTPADPADPQRALVTVAAGAAASISIDNRFDPPLPATGGDLRASVIIGASALVLLGGGALALLISRRRRRA